MSSPTFKGLRGEKPDPHLLKANDFLGNNITPGHQKSYNFVYTLAHVAREWHENIFLPAD